MGRKTKTVVPPARKHGRHRHDNGRRIALARRIESIEQTELTQSERDVLAQDRNRWQRMGAGGHLDDWLAYYPGLSIRRRLAMKVAHTNRPEGSGYNQYFGELMRKDGLDPSDKNFSHVLWIGDDPEREKILRDIRAAMTPGQRSRMNSPIAARQRITAVLKGRASGTEESVRGSPLALLKAKLAEQTRQIAHLEEQLAAAEHRDGSLFDLKQTPPTDIGRVIVAHVSETKAREISKAIIDNIAIKRKQKKPAG